MGKDVQMVHSMSHFYEFTAKSTGLGKMSQNNKGVVLVQIFFRYFGPGSHQKIDPCSDGI